MKGHILIFITILLLSCKESIKKKENVGNMNPDLESFAFDGISVDFQFNSSKPIFGDLFLIVGFENPNFPPENKEFEKLQHLGFDQVDDYFGIKNKTENGDDVKLWLSPVINQKEVYHNEGPFDAIRLRYGIVRNTPDVAELFEKTFKVILSNLDVTPTINGKPVGDFNEIKQKIDETIQYCRQELKVEPGSDKALQLDW